MRELFSVIVFLPMLYWCFYIKNTDKFCPQNILSVLYLFSIAVPTFVIGCYDHLDISLSPVFKSACMNDTVFIMYVILQIICYFLIIIGLNINIKHFRNNESYNNFRDKYINTSKLKKLAIVIFLIGFISSFYFIQLNGGLLYFLDNIRFRTVFLRESGFIKWLIPLTSYGTLIYLYAIKWHSKKEVLISIFLIVVSGFCTGMGGRKALIILIIEAIIIYNYKVKRFKTSDFINLKSVGILVIIYIFMSGYVVLRNPESFGFMVDNPVAFIEASNIGILELLYRESYVTFYMGIIEYFQTADYWFGSSYLGLISAFIPSFLYPQKPPVDDGMYLYSIAVGRKDVLPVMPFDELNGSSLPLETFGAMYANFGYIGLFVGMLVLGIIIGSVYRYMYIKRFSFVTVVLYTNMVFTFHLSTLRIVQTLLLCLVLMILSTTMKQLLRIRIRK